MENTNEYYLKEAPIKKAVKHLSIPMMLGLSIGTIYNVINAYFIGLLRNTDMLSAVTLGLPIFIVLMAIGNMFGVGGGTFITRLIAKDEIDKAKNIASYVIYSSFIFSIIVAVLGIIFINPITSVLGASGSVFSVTKKYIIACLVLGFMVVINFALEQIVRCTGASKESMYGMAISAIVNLILDPLLILVFHFDLVGAAVAMSVANLASAIYYAYYLQRKSEKLRNFFRIRKISFKDKIEIYKIGVPELIQMSFMLVTTLLLNNFCMEYGDNVTASIGIALRIVQVPEFLSMGIVLGVIPLLAYNYSSENFKRFNLGLKSSFKYIALISVFFFIVVFILRKEVVGLFTSSNEVIRIGTYILTAMLVSQLFNGIAGLFLGIFQASGKGTPTIIISIAQGVLSIPVIIIGHSFFGLDGVIWSTTVTELITFVLGSIMFLIVFNPFKSKKICNEVA